MGRLKKGRVSGGLRSCPGVSVEFELRSIFLTSAEKALGGSIPQLTVRRFRGPKVTQPKSLVC